MSLLANNTPTDLENHNQKIFALNGLRGIAILMILFDHFLGVKLSQKLNFHWFFDLGWTGVNLFFILSGFVLYRPFFLGFKKIESGKDLLKFYLHRAGRLYPLLIFYCLIVVFFKFKGNQESIQSFFEVITTTSVFSKQGFYPYLNPVLWSIQVEIQFSILFPLLLWLINRFKFERVFISILLLSFIVRFLGTYLPFHDDFRNPIKDGILGRLDDFMIGFYLVRLYYTKKYFHKAGILCLFGVLALAFGFLFWEVIKWHYIPYQFAAVANNFLQLGYAAITLAVIFNQGKLNKFFSFPVLQVFGIMCYSIYVWHLDFKNLFVALYEYDLIDLIASFLAFMLIAAFTYRYIENAGTKEWKKLFLLK